MLSDVTDVLTLSAEQAFPAHVTATGTDAGGGVAGVVRQTVATLELTAGTMAAFLAVCPPPGNGDSNWYCHGNSTNDHDYDDDDEDDTTTIMVMMMTTTTMMTTPMMVIMMITTTIMPAGSDNSGAMAP